LNYKFGKFYPKTTYKRYFSSRDQPSHDEKNFFNGRRLFWNHQIKASAINIEKVIAYSTVYSVYRKSNFGHHFFTSRFLDFALNKCIINVKDKIQIILLMQMWSSKIKVQNRQASSFDAWAVLIFE